MKKIPVIAVFSAVSAIICMMFCGFRIGFVFVDNEVFNGFCYLLWGIFITNSVMMLFRLRQALVGGKDFPKVLYGIMTGITALSAVCTAAFLIIGGSEEFMNYVYTLPVTLPYLAAFYALAFFVLVFPHCSRTFRRVTTAVATGAVAVCALAFSFPAGGFAFRCSPVVFDGGDSYKVAFATNRKSLGYVQYEYNGETVTLWNLYTGRKEAQTVHSIDVPYEHLNGNSYTVGAVRVYEDIAYGGHTGKTITETVDRLSPYAEDDLDLLCITDNHACRIDWTQLKGDYDAALFLGDFANAVYSNESMIKNLLIPAAAVSNGEFPVIYVRGNHETRGSYAKAVHVSLGYDELYYRINMGKYVFTVLDTGEDKPDDHFEYAGFNDYASYTAKQAKWIQSLPKADGYQLVLAHSPGLFTVFEQAQTAACSALKELGVQLIIGGHHHTTKYAAAEDNATGIAYYVCGAKNGMKDLNYTVMNMNAGEVTMASYNLAGEELCRASQTLTEN